MATRIEVEDFLSKFKVKLEIFGIFFLDRDKNVYSLTELGITRFERLAVVKSIEVDDYSEGPIRDQLNVLARCGCLARTSRDRRYISKLHLDTRTPILSLFRFMWLNIR